MGVKEFKVVFTLSSETLGDNAVITRLLVFVVKATLTNFLLAVMAERLGRRSSLMLWCNVLNIVADVLMSLAWVRTLAGHKQVLRQKVLTLHNNSLCYVSQKLL